MLLYLAAFAAGVLTIASPCILPVLPFVLSSADQPFRTRGLPLLAGMALAFAAVGTFAAFAGSWAVRANALGRDAALALFLVFGLSLLWPALSERMARPFVRLGERLGSRGGTGLGKALLLGVATGLLWTPCAGPILGLILTGAAVRGAAASTGLLLLAFAAGAALPLALVLLAGGRALGAMKRSLGAEVWIRRGLGVAVLLGATAVALGWDTGLLARISPAQTAALETSLLHRASPQHESVGDRMPELSGAVAWLNSPPLSREALAGKVVLIDFWTYSCINCLRSIPYVKSWAKRYGPAGLVVIGAHSPEFAFEKDPANVARAVRQLGIRYPVAVDSDLAIWRAFGNEYWPAHYFVDARGMIRGHHFGEGDYEGTEARLRELLEENHARLPPPAGRPAAHGAEAPSDFDQVGSPETYVGYARQENFASLEAAAPGHPQRYSAPERLALNQWALSGEWIVGPEDARLLSSNGKILFRFHARDLHLVLGPSREGEAPVHFRVRLDGKPPGGDHGVDADAEGLGTVKEHRLYQLIRQKGHPAERTFEIEFLDPGVRAYAFTFG